MWPGDLLLLVEIAEHRESERSGHEQNEEHEADSEENGGDDPQDPPGIGGASVLGRPTAGVYRFELFVPHHPGEWAQDLAEDEPDDPENQNGGRLTGLGICARFGWELWWL
jgi:hypothetical protein